MFLSSQIITYFVVSGMIINGFLLYRTLVTAYHWILGIQLPLNPQHIQISNLTKQNNELKLENIKLRSDLDKVNELIIRKTLEK